ncbi:Pr6Pr family membrane protein [Streptomyces sp. NPDC059740]|uniref:Pr6Pr family membrane protein n=1 Tax=Streptomyces sp. NPDC059740 TaxID=3346926 RepID=UPI0036500E1E
MIDPTRSTHYSTGPAAASAQTPATAVAPPVRRPLTAAFRALLATVSVVGIVMDIALTDDLWRVLSYFTIQSNLMVALCLAWSAHRAWTGRPALSPRITGAVVLFIVITGLVYHFILTGGPSGFAMAQGGDNGLARTVSNHLMHTVAPLGVALDWLLLTPPDGFRLRYAWQWLLYPLLYLPFALLRGLLLAPGTPGRYPYPFLDVDAHGYGGVLLNAVYFTVAFYALALLLVGLDRIRPYLGGPRSGLR